MKNNTRTIESQKSIIETLRREIKHSTIRLRSIQTMIRNLETSKHGMELEIEKLNKSLVQGGISKEMADSSLALIQAKINSIDKKILDKKGKLEEAQKKLYDVQEKLSEYQDCIAEKQQSLASLDEKRAAAELKTIAAEEKYSTVKSKFNEIAPSVNKSVMSQMAELGFHLSSIDMETRLKKYNALKGSLPAELRNILDDLFEGSIIGEIGENSANICAIATSLYLGYLDHATEISKSHGGGGGPGTGWGKKDDEDDLAFRRRCFGMAKMMLKPSRQSIGNRRGRH